MTCQKDELHNLLKTKGLSDGMDTVGLHFSTDRRRIYCELQGDFRKQIQENQDWFVF